MKHTTIYFIRSILLVFGLSLWFNFAASAAERLDLVADTTIATGTYTDVIVGEDVTLNVDGDLTVSDTLLVHGTLIVTGDLSIGNNGTLITHEDAVVVVFGSATLSNNSELSLSSYFIIVENLTKLGDDNDKHVDASVDNASIYVFNVIDGFGTILTKCTEGNYEGVTDVVGDSCDAGGLVDFINIVDPDSLPEGVYEEIVDKELNESSYLNASPEVLCEGYSSTLVISDPDSPQKVSWYLNGSRIAKDSEPTREVTTEGDYYAVYKNSSGWFKTNTVTLTVQEALELPELISNYEGGCVPEIPDYDTFINASTQFPDIFQSNGSVNSSCLSAMVSSLTSSDVYVGESCPKTVERTYTLTLSDGSTFTATQNLILVDNTAPVINGGSPLNSVTATADPANCLAEISVPFDFTTNNVTDNCDLTNTEATYSFYPGNDTSAELVSGAGNITNYSFPVGTTTVYWTVTDFCDNSSDPTIQYIVVSNAVSVESITYDDNSTDTAPGSGIQPMLTSTHDYVVDSGEPVEAFIYSWEVLNSSNTSVATIGAGSGLSSISVVFDSSTFSDSTDYKIVVTKQLGACSVADTLNVFIQPLLDISIPAISPVCTNPTAETELIWTIELGTEATTGLDFDYEILFDGSPIRSGQYSAPGSDIAFSQNAGEPAKISLTFSVATSNINDRLYQLDIKNATVSYEVSEVSTNNNSQDGTIWGQPSISFE